MGMFQCHLCLTPFVACHPQLFIGGLSYGTDAFASFGDVSEARVITDRDTGRSRGFGFVSFADTESASSALSAMDGQQLNGRNIRDNYATDRPPLNDFGQGGGYRSGYNNGGANDGF